MKVTVDGKTYEFDLDSLSMDEAEIIEDYARIDVPDFFPALRAVKVRAIRALVFIVKRRAGEDCKWSDLGSLDLLALAQSMVHENADEAPGSTDEATEGAATSSTAATSAPLTKLAAGRRPRKPKTVKAAEPEPAQAS